MQLYASVHSIIFCSSQIHPYSPYLLYSHVYILSHLLIDPFSQHLLIKCLLNSAIFQNISIPYIHFSINLLALLYLHVNGKGAVSYITHFYSSWVSAFNCKLHSHTFTVFLTDTMICSLEESGMDPSTFWLVDEWLSLSSLTVFALCVLYFPFCSIHSTFSINLYVPSTIFYNNILMLCTF